MEHFPSPPFAVFDEFGKSCDDRVQDFYEKQAAQVDFEWLRQEGYAEGRYDERIAFREDVLRELLEWEAEYMQQARGGDSTGKSDARADAAREIHDHLRSSWNTSDKVNTVIAPPGKGACVTGNRGL